MLQTLKATVVGLWLLAAAATSSAFAENGGDLVLGEPMLPHSSSLETFDLPDIADGQILADALGPVDLSDVLSQYVGATTAPDMPTLDDKTVDVSNSRKLNEVMQKAGMDVQYIEFERGGHSLAFNNAERKMLKRTEAFFAKHIGKTEMN